MTTVTLNQLAEREIQVRNEIKEGLVTEALAIDQCSVEIKYYAFCFHDAAEAFVLDLLLAHDER